MGAAAGICAREVALSVATHTHRRVARGSARALRGPFYMLHLRAVSRLARESLTKAVPAPRPVILARRVTCGRYVQMSYIQRPSQRHVHVAP